MSATARVLFFTTLAQALREVGGDFLHGFNLRHCKEANLHNESLHDDEVVALDAHGTSIEAVDEADPVLLGVNNEGGRRGWCTVVGCEGPKGFGGRLKLFFLVSTIAAMLGGS
ncbi:hypothetical protein E2542_SST10010 [Spatholobus suberectus]|nr:hypothetical protein E2542_SST10010 [Spatholobus suberectus]